MNTTTPTLLMPLAYLTEELSSIAVDAKKMFSKIRKLADSPELAKAMHEDQTCILSHINRLKLVKKEWRQTVKKESVVAALDFHLPAKLAKGSDRDLWLIAKAQQVLSQKLSLYKVTYVAASHLKLENAAMLLEQTIAENEATAEWLNRILPRILNGDHIIPIQSENVNP